SDKLLKSDAISALSCCCEVAYITLSSFRVKHFFQHFFSGGSSYRSFLSTPHFVNRCAVSMDAHYRELFAARNR
ncbi:hypothetical protein, partial [Pantoea sp. SM3]|uniref:hypothetical protein n=1 Tax=Pantoea sp. SM3 TaxID=1628192 RepID=UPI001E2FD329